MKGNGCVAEVEEFLALRMKVGVATGLRVVKGVQRVSRVMSADKQSTFAAVSFKPGSPDSQ